jgi:hypothetical protein
LVDIQKKKRVRSNMNMPYTGAKARIALSFRPASGDDLELRYLVFPLTVTFGQDAWFAADVAEAIYYMIYFKLVGVSS